MKRSFAVAALACTLLATSPAFAGGDDVARAEKLFDEALALTDKGEWTAACPKLEESQRLDPALGTEFNIADCWEHLGRIGGAYRLFTAVAKASSAAGNAKLAAKATQRAEALEGRVGHLRVVFAEAQRGAVVQIDAVDVPVEAWATGYGLDPGDHVVAITAAERIPWSRHVTVEAAKTVDVAVTLDVASASGPATKRRDPLYRVGGASLAAVGVVGLGIGAVFGLSTLSTRNDARERCPNPSPCFDRQGADLWNDAKASGDISTVAFIAGGVLVAAGAVLWFIAPSRSVSAAASGARLEWTF